MEDVTDPAFRLLCKRYGADMLYTEFVSSEALIRSVNRTKQKLTIYPEERPIGIQIYGHDTDSMVEAAKIAEEANPELMILIWLSCQKGSSQGCRSRSAERYSSNVGYYHKSS